MKKFGYLQKESFLFPQIIGVLAFILTLAVSLFQIYAKDRQSIAEYQKLTELQRQTQAALDAAQAKLISLESDDQYLRNQTLEQEMKQTQHVFAQTITVYQKLTDMKQPKLEQDFAAVLTDLANLQYATASAKLSKLNTDIDKAIAATQALKGIDLASLTVSNTPPGSGYQRQKVTVDGQDFVVDIVAADLNTTKVVVDTASDSDCRDNCPVLPLATYAARNGAFAAINGSYFCPASYPSCVGKTNSFDLLVMNKNKTYFNSDNNIYSANPAVIFSNSSVRFVAHAQEWGRDTSVDGVISNFPLLVFGGQTQFGGDDDPKKSSVGYRPFVANKGSIVYIGIVRNASVAQSAKVLQSMGMDNAMNLDSGGSTALWVNGAYKAGPGRDIPNAILFLRK